MLFLDTYGIASVQLILTTGRTELHAFGILLVDRQLASRHKWNLRTYDVNDYVMRELEYDPHVVIRVRKFRNIHF